MWMKKNEQETEKTLVNGEKLTQTTISSITRNIIRIMLKLLKVARINGIKIIKNMQSIGNLIDTIQEKFSRGGQTMRKCGTGKAIRLVIAPFTLGLGAIKALLINVNFVKLRKQNAFIGRIRVEITNVALMTGLGYAGSVIGIMTNPTASVIGMASIYQVRYK